MERQCRWHRGGGGGEEAREAGKELSHGTEAIQSFDL